MERRRNVEVLVLLMLLIISALSQTALAAGKAKKGGPAVATTTSTTKEPATKGSFTVTSVANAKANVSIAASGDLLRTGNCSKELRTFCPTLRPGKAVLLDCISGRLKVEKLGNEPPGLAISPGCRTEVRAFKIEMYKDLTFDLKMNESCQTDITKWCEDEDLYLDPVNVVACLREVNQVEPLTPACKAEVFRAQLDAAEDFAMDPQLNLLCEPEVEKLCKGVQPDGGEIQACLRSQLNRLAWDCEAELVRQEVENVNDIRLNVRLFKACLTDKKKFCNEVQPGDARVQDCLEQHREDPDFSPTCKQEFDKMMARRATDFRLDVGLRKYCKDDISHICFPDPKEITDVASFDANVIQCLQDYSAELKDPLCHQQVYRLTVRAAEDIRFDVPLSKACSVDRKGICGEVPDGQGKVFKCLQENREKLKTDCKSALFYQELRASENIDFDYNLKKGCSAEMNTVCKGVPAGHGAGIKCLEGHLANADMGADCKKEVERVMIRGAEDYRLNYRLNKACFKDVWRMCIKDWLQLSVDGALTCKGTVLKCLSTHKDKIESKECEHEVLSFERLEVADVRLDVPLQASHIRLTSTFPSQSSTTFAPM